MTRAKEFATFARDFTAEYKVQPRADEIAQRLGWTIGSVCVAIADAWDEGLIELSRGGGE